MVDAAVIRTRGCRWTDAVRARARCFSATVPVRSVTVSELRPPPNGVFPGRRLGRRIVEGSNQVAATRQSPVTVGYPVNARRLLTNRELVVTLLSGVNRQAVFLRSRRSAGWDRDRDMAGGSGGRHERHDHGPVLPRSAASRAQTWVPPAESPVPSVRSVRPAARVRPAQLHETNSCFVGWPDRTIPDSAEPGLPQSRPTTGGPPARRARPAVSLPFTRSGKGGPGGHRPPARHLATN
jgi:hypothetical protein